MIFLKSTPLLESVDKSKLVFKKELRYVNSILKVNSAFVLNFTRRYLLNGDSYHLGSLHFVGEKHSGVNSRLFKMLAEKNIFLTDTSALPELPPGPHTAISAALAKVTVKKSLSS
jgi:hypothetical protein